ncbi:MAG: YciI family protein [Amnibacterium sp.]
MQYLINVLHDSSDLATDEEMAAIDVFNERLVADGRLVLAAGLSTPDRATVLDNRDGRGMVSDGPFAELSEWIIGFWVIEAPDDETAGRLAADGSKACNRRVELRPLLAAPE